MTIAERLNAIVSAMPAGGSVVLPVADLREWLAEDERGSGVTYNLTEAARLSGYSPDYLGRLVRQGRIPNAGRKKAPRIRDVDLPRRAPGMDNSSDFDEIAYARAVVSED